MEWAEPAYAHIPLIHGSDGAKLSKRHGAASAKGGEFHGAWPYDLPPKGHYNYFAAAGIILQGAIYIDLFMPPPLPRTLASQPFLPRK